MANVHTTYHHAFPFEDTSMGFLTPDTSRPQMNGFRVSNARYLNNDLHEQRT
jgi:hypothetical protein